MHRGSHEDSYSKIVAFSQDGQVASALNERFNYVKAIKVREEGNKDVSEMMQWALDHHWMAFLKQCYLNFSAIGCCPYVVETVVTRFQGKNEKFKVPVALRLGEFTYQTTREEDGMLTRVFKQKGYKNIKVVFSQQHGGAVGDSAFDSELGLLLGAWEDLQRREVLYQAALQLAIKPRMFLEPVQETSKPVDLNEQELMRAEAHRAAKYGQTGFIEPEEEATVRRVGDFHVLPKGYRLARADQSLPLAQFDPRESRERFDRLLETTIGVRGALNDRRDGFAGRKTAEEVHDDQSHLVGMLDKLTLNLSKALEQVWRCVHDSDAEVHVVHRTKLDVKTVVFLHASGVLDDAGAKEYLAQSTGVKISDSSAPLTFAHNSNLKRARLDSD